MTPTQMNENAFETLVVESLINEGGYRAGQPGDYQPEHAVDIAKLLEFLRNTQPEAVETADLENDGPGRLKFLRRLQREITKKGTLDHLRSGVKHGSLSVELFYATPTPGNTEAEER
ncbi:MAG: type I restriction endonuclease subunit R, partial [bacterium]|nr:type I restriction endonuclease subunit R [bacterium]